MSTNRFLWVAACISISVALAGSVSASDAARRTALELELAETPDVYMVIDLEAKVLQLKARGIILDEVALTSVAALERSSFLALGSGDPLELPTVWRVFAKPGGGSRPVLTPTLDGPSDEAPPVVKPQLNVTAPTRYDFPVEEGWTIEVGPFDDAPGFFSRFWGAVGSGFDRLILRSPGERGRSLRLGVDPPDAERLHHLFRKGFAIMVVREMTNEE